MIRPATLADIPAMVELGRSMVAESPRLNWLAYSGEKVAALIAALIEKEDGFAWVGLRDEHVVAALIAVIDEYWASDDRMAHELTLFVAPEARGNTVAARLVCEMIEWARESGVRRLTAGTSTGIDPELTARLYERFGFERAGIGLEFRYV